MASYAPRTVKVKATRSVNRNLAQRLNPNVVGAGPLASITGNAPLLRTGRLNTGAQASPFTQDDRLAALAQQLLDPTLTAQQSSIAQATSRGAAARGLVGGAVNVATTNQRNSFLAGNRIEAIQGLSQGIEERVGKLSSQLDPFYGLVGGSLTDLFNQPGSQTNYLKLREAIGRRNLSSDVTAGLFSGLETFGRGGIVQGALAQQLGFQGGIQDLANTQENAELLAALQQFLDPQLSRAQLGDPRAVTDPTRNFDRATNQLLGGARLTQFFQEQIGGINDQFLDLQQTALSLSGFEGETDAARNARIANTDFSRFRNLLAATGITPPKDIGADAQAQVGQFGMSDFLERSRQAREQFTAPVRPLGVGGRIPRGNTRMRIQVI